jgi:hypothetical protein
MCPNFVNMDRAKVSQNTLAISAYIRKNKYRGLINIITKEIIKRENKEVEKN